MKGKVIKAHRGIFYVDTDSGVILSKARGLFRENKTSVLVGDIVEVDISSDGTGYILDVENRINSLIRPQVANIDLALAVFSINEPDLNPYLLDKNLIMTEHFGIDTVIIFTKSDKTSLEDIEKWERTYTLSGYKVIVTNKFLDDASEILSLLRNKTSAVFGPSGSGKSSLINKLNPGRTLEVSNISQKTKRGMHTTRHVELFSIAKDSYILDTPGFSSMSIEYFSDEWEIEKAFREFDDLKGQCRFQDCLHLNEPNCNVKAHLGSIVQESRYENYKLFIEEFKKIRRH